MGLPTLRKIKSDLEKKSLAFLEDDNTRRSINQYVLMVLNNPNGLSNEDISNIKQILEISDIVYNNTSKSALLLDDDVYDNLLELYRNSGHKLKVGAEPIEFKDSPEVYGKMNSKTPLFISLKNINAQYGEYGYNMMRNSALYLSNPILYDMDESRRGKKSNIVSHEYQSLVGTLHKCKYVYSQDAIRAGVYDDPTVKILDRDFFAPHVSKGILNPNIPFEIVCELKYDGISVVADIAPDGSILTASSRGDTSTDRAQDLTNILGGYTFDNPIRLFDGVKLGVKFEAIITKSNLHKLEEITNRVYANPRNAIIGLFSNVEAYRYRDFITLVPLDLEYSENGNVIEFPVSKKIGILNTHFKREVPLNSIITKGTLEQNLAVVKQYLDTADAYRPYMPFAYDGIVVHYNDPVYASALGRENYINLYSMAVKFSPAEKITTVRDVSFTVGSSGNITPMIYFDPIGFNGAIYDHLSGYSVKRFNELSLHEGDKVVIHYRNEVMPYISDVISRANDKAPFKFIDRCPICNTPLEFSSTGASAKCPNPYCLGKLIPRLVKGIQILGIKGISDAYIYQLYDFCKVSSLYDLLNLNKDTLIILGNAIGESTYKAFSVAKEIGVSDYIVLAAIGFSNISINKWKSILKFVDYHDIKNASDSKLVEELSHVPNIGQVAINTILKERVVYKRDLLLLETLNIESSYKQTTACGNCKTIRFTGFRDYDLAKYLCDLGHDCDVNGTVTKKTNILLVPYQGFTSSKVSKVGPDKVVPVEEFKANMNYYLNR